MNLLQIINQNEKIKKAYNSFTGSTQENCYWDSFNSP